MVVCAVLGLLAIVAALIYRSRARTYRKLMLDAALVAAGQRNDLVLCNEPSPATKGFLQYYVDGRAETWFYSSTQHQKSISKRLFILRPKPLRVHEFDNHSIPEVFNLFTEGELSKWGGAVNARK
jgi:hypothetical protein